MYHENIPFFFGSAIFMPKAGFLLNRAVSSFEALLQILQGFIGSR
jgi:gamma-glutamyltranspeptidase